MVETRSTTGVNHRQPSSFVSVSVKQNVQELYGQAILPPTPVGFAEDLIASPNPDPQILQGLWEDFDRVVITPRSPGFMMDVYVMDEVKDDSPTANNRKKIKQHAAGTADISGSEWGGEEEVDLRKRGKYRCRKCGEAKRAHDCPFACKQRSVATQTNLEITGGCPPVFTTKLLFPSSSYSYEQGMMMMGGKRKADSY